LHTAILIGALTSLVLYCAKASQAAALVALSHSGPGDWRVIPVPEAVENDAVTVLQYSGVGLFAEVPRIAEQWPRVTDSHNAVVVLGLRTLPDVPSSKVIKALRGWAHDLESNGGRLILAGVSPETARVLERGGLMDVLGADGVVPASDIVFGPAEEAVQRGERWVAAHRDTPTD
jgi:SulP family sulfate permease